MTEPPVQVQPPAEPAPDSSPPAHLPIPAPGPAVQAHLVADINPVAVDRGSSPSQFMKLAERVLFLAATPNEGRELWSWQAQKGAQLLLDLEPGEDSPYYSAFARVGDFVYFGAQRYSMLKQLQLWRSDGTVAGTRALPGLIPAGEDLSFSAYAHLADVPDRLLLLRDSGTELELWSSDGTSQGSHPLWSASRDHFLPQPVVELGGSLFFITGTSCPWDQRTCDNPPELWRADASGQKLLWRGQAGSTLANLTVWKGSLIFSLETREGDTSLWKTDGTGSEPVQFMVLEPGAMPQHLTATGGPLFFQAMRQSHFGVWATDATAAGTVWLHDVQEIEPMYRGEVTQPGEMAAVGTTDYFLTQDSSADVVELWRTDGTLEGTRCVQSAISYHRGLLFNLLAYQGRLYFLTYPEPYFSSAAWMRTDGTPEGTEEVKRFQPVPNYGSTPGAFTVLDGELFFAADDGQGQEPWSSRGTASDTRLLQNLVPPGGGSDPQKLTAVQGTLYFTANDGVRGQELWRTDGSAAGTRLVHEFAPGPDPTSFGYLLAFGSKLAVTSQEYYYSSTSLWLTDGGSEGMQQVFDHLHGRGGCIDSVDIGECSGDVVVAGETLYVSNSQLDNAGAHGYSFSLFAMRDGGPLRALRTWNEHNPTHFSRSGASLYFVAPPPAGSTADGQGLWRTEGTSESTRMLMPLPGMEDSVWLDSALYFVSRDPAVPWWPQGLVLWRADEAAGEARLVSTGQGTLNIQAGMVVASGHRLFFMSRSYSQLWSLWVSDGTEAGTHRLKEWGLDGRVAWQTLMPVRDGILFWFEDAERGWSLWRSDGTEAGTTLLKALSPPLSGSLSGEPSFAVQPDGQHVLFSASDGVSGMEPWVSDGTSAGTVLYADVAAGPASSNPGAFTLMGDTLYFAADDQHLGRELWAAPLPGTAPRPGP